MWSLQTSGRPGEQQTVVLLHNLLQKEKLSSLVQDFAPHTIHDEKDSTSFKALIVQFQRDITFSSPPLFLIKMNSTYWEPRSYSTKHKNTLFQENLIFQDTQ